MAKCTRYKRKLSRPLSGHAGLSRSSGSSVIGRACVDPLRLRQIGRADRHHLHREARGRRRHHDHVATQRRERIVMSAYLSRTTRRVRVEAASALSTCSAISFLLRNSRRPLTRFSPRYSPEVSDAPDAERMFKGDDYPPRADGHPTPTFRKGPEACALSPTMATAFSADETGGTAGALPGDR